jgi:hypothetical protein
MEFLFEEDIVAKLEELRNEINGVLDNKVNKEEIDVKADKEQLEDMKNNIAVLLENKIDKLEGHSLMADDEIERLSKRISKLPNTHIKSKKADLTESIGCVSS